MLASASLASVRCGLASASSASVRWLSLSKPMDAMKKCKKTSLTDYLEFRVRSLGSLGHTRLPDALALTLTPDPRPLEAT